MEQDGVYSTNMLYLIVKPIFGYAYASLMTAPQEPFRLHDKTSFFPSPRLENSAMLLRNGIIKLGLMKMFPKWAASPPPLGMILLFFGRVNWATLLK